jgi:hypothetical protein
MAEERRKRTRVSVAGEVEGRINSISSAPVLNLSENGALLEVYSVLRPGSFYMLRVPLSHGDQVNLKSRVVRSYVHTVETNNEGESVVHYRAAVEFVSCSEEDRAALRSHIGEMLGYLDEEF